MSTIVGPENLICVSCWDANTQRIGVPVPSVTPLFHLNYQEKDYPFWRRRPAITSRYYTQPGYSLINHEVPSPALVEWNDTLRFLHPSDPLCVLYGAHTFIFPNIKNNALTADTARPLLNSFAQFLTATQAHASFDIYPRTKTYTIDQYLAWARVRCQNGILLQNLCQRRVFALVSPQDQENPTCYFEDKPLAPEWIKAQTQVLSEFPSLGSLVFGGVGAAPARACIDRTVPSLLTALVSRTPLAPTA